MIKLNDTELSLIQGGETSPWEMYVEQFINQCNNMGGWFPYIPQPDGLPGLPGWA